MFVQEASCELSTLHTKMVCAFYFLISYLPAAFPPFISFLVMSCGMPVPPVNGSIAGQDFSLGARVTYQCNPGFRLSGPITTSVICQESGRWSPIEAPPRCIREYSSGLQSQVEKTPNHYKKTPPPTRKKIK